VDIVQNCDSYINIPPSQTYRSYDSQRWKVTESGETASTELKMQNYLGFSFQWVMHVKINTQTNIL
jgi:hypothetical protein